MSKKIFAYVPEKQTLIKIEDNDKYLISFSWYNIEAQTPQNNNIVGTGMLGYMTETADSPTFVDLVLDYIFPSSQISDFIIFSGNKEKGYAPANNILGLQNEWLKRFLIEFYTFEYGGQVTTEIALSAWVTTDVAEQIVHDLTGADDKIETDNDDSNVVELSLTVNWDDKLPNKSPDCMLNICYEGKRNNGSWNYPDKEIKMADPYYFCINTNKIKEDFEKIKALFQAYKMAKKL